jgi:hypothetical protein
VARSAATIREETMNKLRVAWRGVLVLAWVAAAFGIAGKARGGPEPDCGPSREWICVVPDCPSCGEVFFDGTVCE